MKGPLRAILHRPPGRALPRRRVTPTLAAVCWALGAALGPPVPLPAQSASPAAAGPWVLPEFLWTGAWESGGNLGSRGELLLGLPKPGLKARFQLLDRRPAFSWGAFTGSFGGATADRALTSPGAALYHASTGSRLIYGPLDHYGLAARTRNIWIRGAPYAESHAPSSADLKTAPSSTAANQVYLYLGSPYLRLGREGENAAGSLRGFVSFKLGPEGSNSAGGEQVPGLNAGVDYRFGGTGLLRLEGYYTERVLPERKSSSWFSEKPALPERTTRLYAGALAFNVPAFGLAADLARSETFGFGADLYGSLGLRFGDKPWRFSLALDRAGSRFVDAGGAAPGEGLRAAARLERRSARSSLLRFSALLRGPGPAEGLGKTLGMGDAASTVEGFNRTSLDFYYRFPAASVPWGLSRVSLTLDRDGREEKKVLDSAETMAALKLGPVDAVTGAKITWRADGGEYYSHRWSQSAAWKLGNPGIHCTARAGYEAVKGKGGTWALSLSAQRTVRFRGRQNRFSLKAASPEFPKKWDYTVGWRLQF
ncbi:MAG: hypothetical protein LBG84_09120 [Treponema sp.]|jgi:hypothetical protein|nr:hypothetical protein [Treponema sp.]